VATPPIGLTDVTGIASLIVLIWVKVEQKLDARNVRKATKEVAAEVKQDLKVNTAETKDSFQTIKTMLNGERLNLLKAKADALCVVADLRNGPGDVENYDRAVAEYHRLKETQAVLLAKQLQIQIDMDDLKRIEREKAWNSQ